MTAWKTCSPKHFLLMVAEASSPEAATHLISTRKQLPPAAARLEASRIRSGRVSGAKALTIPTTSPEPFLKTFRHIIHNWEHSGLEILREKIFRASRFLHKNNNSSISSNDLRAAHSLLARMIQHELLIR